MEIPTDLGTISGQCLLSLLSFPLPALNSVTLAHQCVVITYLLVSLRYSIVSSGRTGTTFILFSIVSPEPSTLSGTQMFLRVCVYVCVCMYFLNE